MAKKERLRRDNPFETFKLEKQTINFYGEGYDWLFEQNYKLITLRKDSPKYHVFHVGEHVNANCNGKDVPIVIWGFETAPLRDIDPIVRGLDGFITLEQALEMRRFSGYEDYCETTPTTVIAAMHEKFFDKLTDRQKEVLLGQNDGRPLKEIVRDQELREIVLRSLAFWVNERSRNESGIPTAAPKDWLSYFEEIGLITPETLQEIEEYDYTYGLNIFSTPGAATYLFKIRRPDEPFDPRNGPMENYDYEELYCPYVLGDMHPF